jgi:hypothetical protein
MYLNILSVTCAPGLLLPVCRVHTPALGHLAEATPGERSSCLDLFCLDSITQKERPDHYAQYDFPPYQIGVGYSKKPAGKPESPCEATCIFHIPAPFPELYLIM